MWLGLLIYTLVPPSNRYFIFEIAAKMSGFRCQICKGSLTKVHYPKLYNMAHLLALNVLLLPKDLTIIFIHIKFGFNWPIGVRGEDL